MPVAVRMSSDSFAESLHYFQKKPSLLGGEEVKGNICPLQNEAESPFIEEGDKYDVPCHAQ